MFSGYKLKNAYIFENLIGSGGMGEVWSAKRISLGDRVAVKVLKISNSQPNASQRDQLKKEAKITSLINHPNICKIFDFVEEENACFLIMEYLDGVDLQILLSRPVFFSKIDRVEFALYVSKQILKALIEAHNINHSTISRILHRDIKPANIFITKFGEVKLLDLGIAKAETDLDKTTTSNLFYSIHYTDPLLWKNGHYDLSQYSSDSDVFLLGLVFYEIVSGEKAFPGEGKRLYESLEKGIVPSIKKYIKSEQLNIVFEKWINNSKEKRFDSAKVLLQELIFLSANITLDDIKISNLIAQFKNQELKKTFEHTEHFTKKSTSDRYKIFFTTFVFFIFIMIGYMGYFKPNNSQPVITIKSEQNIKNNEVDCSSNQPEKCNLLGFKFLKGEGGIQNFNLAKSLFEKAALNGSIEAQSRLGYMYLNGLGGPKDFVKAKFYFEKASSGGYAKAQLNLGLMHLNGLGGTKNLKEARFWIEKASVQGLQEAVEQLQLLSRKDSLTIKDESYYRKYCEAGALNQCAWVAKYEYDKGNKNEAKHLYEKACHYGDVDACQSLGFLKIELGNEKEGRLYLTIACRNNLQRACEAIGDLTLLNADKKEALSTIEKQCDYGKSSYCFYLSRIYSHDKLIDQSIKYLEKALILGFSEWERIEDDEDLKYIRKNKKFADLIAKYKKK